MMMMIMVCGVLVLHTTLYLTFECTLRIKLFNKLYMNEELWNENLYYMPYFIQKDMCVLTVHNIVILPPCIA